LKSTFSAQQFPLLQYVSIVICLAGHKDRQTDGRWHIACYSMYAVAR